jgi:hypothetical protein
MHKVGDIVWVFDRNHRVYRKDASTGLSAGGPIFREHFRPVIISGETPRSWVLYGSGVKVPKSGGDVRECGTGPYGKRTVYMTPEAVDTAVYLHDHRHKIARALEMCADVAALRQIAALVGYKGED